MSANTIPLTFQTGTFTHSVFYTVPKSLQHLQPALHTSLRLVFPPDVGLGLSVKYNSTNTMIELALASAEDCSKALSSPIAVENHEFSASPAYSSINVLHKISLTDISPAPQEVLKSSLLLTFARFGVVKDIVIYNDDITGEWFTGNGHVYLEIPRESDASFEPLTHRIQLNGSDTSVLATWARMPDFCRYCKAMGHIKENCDKRPADSRTCFICHQKGHISYQRTRSQDREPQPHKRPRNREPNSAITSRRIATPKIKKGSKAISSLDLIFGPTAMPPAQDIQSSATTTSSKIENTENTPDPNESLMKPMMAFTPPSEGPGPDSDVSISSPVSSAPLLSKYAPKLTTSIPSVSSTVLNDTAMTDLADIDFDKFPESSQEGSQDQPSPSEMEV